MNAFIALRTHVNSFVAYLPTIPREAPQRDWTPLRELFGHLPVFRDVTPERTYRMLRRELTRCGFSVVKANGLARVNALPPSA